MPVKMAPHQKPNKRHKALLAASGFKWCPVCKCELPYGAFGANSRAKDGCRELCRECRSVTAKAYYYGNGGAFSAARLNLRYGLTVEQYEDMRAKADGRCETCGRPESDGKPLCVDHCHATGAVRGLLCKQCNVALGAVNDSQETLRSMISYLTSR